MKLLRLCALVCLAGSLLGCGQKGPLLLPDAPKHKRTAPKPPAAPAPAKSGGGAAAPSPAPAGTATGAAPPAADGRSTSP